MDNSNSYQIKDCLYSLHRQYFWRLLLADFYDNKDNPNPIIIFVCTGYLRKPPQTTFKRKQTQKTLSQLTITLLTEPQQNTPDISPMEPAAPPPNMVPMDSPPRHQNHPSNNSTILELQGTVRHLQQENTHLQNLLEQSELENEATVRELEARIQALSETLQETRAAKKKTELQRGYFMAVCDSWGEHAEILRHTLLGLAGQALNEDKPRFCGTSVGWLQNALFAANLFLKVLEDWIQHEQWEKLKKVRFHRHFYGYRPPHLDKQFHNIIPLHSTEPLFPPGFCDGPVFDMNYPERVYSDGENLPQPFGWYRRIPNPDYMDSSAYAVLDKAGDGILTSPFPFWDVELQETLIPIRNALTSGVQEEHGDAQEEECAQMSIFRNA